VGVVRVMAMRHRPVDGAVPRARALRAAMTPAERKLWSMLRGTKLNGVKFRRQAPIGRYIADFLAPAVKLVVEADGTLHTVEADAERTAFLESQGYRVLRFSNAEILAQPEAVWRTIEVAVTGDHPHPPRFARVASPLQGEEGLPPLAGSVEAGVPFADFIWFRTGGAAEWLVRPRDIADLSQFLAALPLAIPVFPVGVGSNLIVRDGGLPGVTVRLPKAFAKVSIEGQNVRAGAAAMGITVASAARDAALAGLEFLRGIPGTAGGAVRMNAGAYGRDVADILVEATVVRRDGRIETLPASAFGFSYRHSALPEGDIVVEALFKGTPGDKAAISAEMDRIAAEREASQPLRSRTGGSTFKNPPGHKAWQLVDAAGCRGLKIGGAQVSEKHTNFLINTGDATSADIETLGDTVRARVLAQSGVALEWEIERVGVNK
jgi:UDP-N-acetylmuramate dehydrogenase